MNEVSRRGFLTLSLGTMLSLSACGKTQTSTNASDSGGDAKENERPRYTYRFADVEEGATLFLDNEDYLAGLNQCDLDYRMQKKNATREEFEAFAVKQVRDFTDEETQAVDTCMALLEGCISERGVTPPTSEEIVFIKMTMDEESGATAYTHGTQIYLNARFLEMMLTIEKAEDYDLVVAILAHELFHCLTRSHPEFRAQMYKIINFDVQDEDYVFGPDVAERMLSNPDVEHHNSSALFTIGGEQKRCAIVFYAKKPFEEGGGTFFDNGGTGLVPVDDLNVLYDSEEASDFWDVFGRNTGYAIDPEETMADNFSFAIVYGREGKEYKTPEIVDAILTELGG